MKTILRTIILLLWILIPFTLCSQNTILRGKAPNYGDKVISFYTYIEPVVHQKHKLAETKIGKDGSFSVSFQVNQTIEIYTDLEKYTGTLIVEPGKDYFITLPPFSPRTITESRSPYFKPALFWLGLPQSDKSDLNFLVRSFISEYNSEIVKNTSLIYKDLSKEKASEIIERLEQKFSEKKGDFFRVLRKYYYADLEIIVNPQNPEAVIKKYFMKEPIYLQNPAYQKTFEVLFTDFLRKQAQDYKNRSIIPLVNSSNYQGLIALFNKKGYNTNITELVVLKGLYDGYYTGCFNKESILKAIEKTQNYGSIVMQIREKLTKLAVKGKAPSFLLKNLKNEAVSLKNYKGKFVYLNFIRSNSAESLFELDTLVSVEKKFRQVLSVISIATDDNFETSAKLWKEKRYSWELLNGSKQTHLSEDYNAGVVPAFYLLDPNGNLILSPSPSPSHGFEPVFIKIFRDYNFKNR